MGADESAGMAVDASPGVAAHARSYAELESRVLTAGGVDGVALRYGFFYGPGTWYRPDGAAADRVRRREMAILGDGSAVWSFVHVDDAVAATVSALTAEPGVYNVVDDDPLPVVRWLPDFARWVGAPEPPRVSLADALATAGEEAVYYHMSLTGASNRRAKEKLRFTPRPLVWKDATA